MVTIPKKTKLKIITDEKLLKVKLHCKGISINKALRPKINEKGRPYYKRNTNEILVGRQNFHNGGFGLVPPELNGGIASSAITSIISIETKLKNQFLIYYFSRYNFYKKVEKYIGGTGQKELSKNQLLNLKIQVPSLDEQNKIVNFLISIDNKINLLQDQIKQMELFKKGLLQQMFI